MTTFKTLFDSLKLSTYEVLVALLPGCAVVGAFLAIFGFGTPSTPELQFLIEAYVVGLALQGVAAWAMTTPADDLVTKAALGLAKDAIKKEFSPDSSATKLPDALVLDYCLSRIEARRAVYDKFVVLRDCMRGLAVAVVAVALFAVIGCIAQCPGESAGAAPGATTDATSGTNMRGAVDAQSGTDARGESDGAAIPVGGSKPSAAGSSPGKKDTKGPSPLAVQIPLKLRPAPTAGFVLMAIVVFLGLRDRFKVYAPLSKRAVYMQYVAATIKPLATV